MDQIYIVHTVYNKWLLVFFVSSVKKKTTYIHTVFQAAANDTIVKAANVSVDSDRQCKIRLFRLAQS